MSKEEDALRAWKDAEKHVSLLIRERDEANAEVVRLQAEVDRLKALHLGRAHFEDEMVVAGVDALRSEIERLTRERDAARREGAREMRERCMARVAWWRNDMSYKAPEQRPDAVSLLERVLNDIEGRPLPGEEE